MTASPATHAPAPPQTISYAAWDGKGGLWDENREEHFNDLHAIIDALYDRHEDCTMEPPFECPGEQCVMLRSLVNESVLMSCGPLSWRIDAGYVAGLISDHLCDQAPEDFDMDLDPSEESIAELQTALDSWANSALKASGWLASTNTRVVVRPEEWDAALAHYFDAPGERVL